MVRPIIGVMALAVGVASPFVATKAAVGVPVKCAAQPRYIGSDVPKLKGRYVAARDSLLRMAYAPVQLSNPSPICDSHDCGKIRILPEAECAVDAPICNMFWRAPDNRILKVSTCGDEFGGKIDAIRWAKPGDLPQQVG